MQQSLPARPSARTPCRMDAYHRGHGAPSPYNSIYVQKQQKGYPDPPRVTRAITSSALSSIGLSVMSTT